jgi:integrase
MTANRGKPKKVGDLWFIFGRAIAEKGGAVAGTVKEAKIGSATVRAKLKPGRQAHWRIIIPGRAHLGYQRKQEANHGRWILRRYVGGTYRIEPLGLADDALLADGQRVLNFEQAEAKARAQVEAPASKIHHITIRRAMANYIEFKRAQGQPAGDVASRSAAHILPMLGDVVVAELTSEQIRKWLAALAASPALVRSKKGAVQKYKPEPSDDEAVRRRRSSANRVLTMLKSALNHAYDEKHVVTNDAWGRRVKPFRDVELARIRYLTVAEAQRLLNVCDHDFRLLVRAALETGCRYGELARLEMQDFNSDAATLTIRKSKSGKARHVVLTDEGAIFFSELTAGRPGNALMFTRQDGGQWRASHQGRPMKQANERAKLSPSITFHGLRHTWASLSVMAGVPLMVVSRNLGHANTNMVEKHYGHLAPSYIADAIRVGAPKFNIKPDKKVAALR